MEPRRTSLRRAGLAALAALLVIGASACSGGSGVLGTPPAATVNGSEISRPQLDAMVTGYRKLFASQVKAARASLKSQIAAGTAQSTEADLEAEIKRVGAPYQVNGYTYPTEGAASQLTQLITLKLYEQAVAETGGKITAADRSQAKDSLTQTDPSFADASKGIQSTYIGISAATAALQREIPKDLQDALAAAADTYEAQLQKLYADNKDSLEQQVCFFALPAADEAAATAAVLRVRGGEDAAAVAGELQGQSTAAQPSCESLSTITSSFGDQASTEPGSILGPLDTGQGFVALVVESSGVPAYKDVRDQIAQSAPDEFTAKAQANIDAWLKKLVGRHAKVTVDPRFGTWDSDSLKVVPPKVPGAPVTTTTAPALPGS